MVHIVFCTENTASFLNIKDLVMDQLTDTDCTALSFEYPMDMLDYLNSARPEKCAVFYAAGSIETGLEISSKTNEINPMYRFNLFCDEPGDVERLFYSGVSYYVGPSYSEESIGRCVDFTKRFYDEQQQKALLLTSRHGTELISFSDIMYVMSDKRKVIVVKENEERSYYYKLDEIEEMLGTGFLRCHQSYIVNMKKIKAFVPDGLMLTNDTFIPVSRKKYYSSKREYLAYITDNKII